MQEVPPKAGLILSGSGSALHRDESSPFRREYGRPKAGWIIFDAQVYLIF
jgi:hypothetical protein